MLTLSKPISAGQAQAYHKSEFANAKENYYTEGERVRGVWQGQLAERWNLKGEVNEEQFARLSEGQHPASGEALIRRQQVREFVNERGETVRTMEHRAGWDATFSAPKSVSVTALVGGDDRVRDAHRESVRVALDEMEKYAQARIGGNAPAQTTGAWAVAKFEHDSSRPVDGYAAPQLHTHAVIFNVTETAEGKTRSLHAHELYKTQQFTTAVYRSELAARLQKLGYEIERGAHGQPEIKGYTREYMEASSPRRQQIEQRLAEQERRGAGAAQIAAHRTRDAQCADHDQQKERPRDRPARILNANGGAKEGKLPSSAQEEAAMQQGSIIQTNRKQGPNVWLFRWSEKNRNGRRVYRKRVIGTVEQYPNGEAARVAAAALLTHLNGNLGHDKRCKTTVEQICEHFEQKELRSGDSFRSFATVKTYRGYIRKWIKPRWGSLYLDEVKAVDVEAWLRRLPMARSSRAKIRNVLSILFNHACRYELFDRNPMRFVRQGAKRRSAPVVLTALEIRALVDHLALRERTLVLLAASTGLRQSELFGLKWRDVDFQRGELSVTRSIVFGVVGRCKTESSQKPVPLHPQLSDALVTWRKTCKFIGSDNWIFASRLHKGRRPYWGASILRKYVRPVAESLKIQKRIGWHTFRHTYSTLLRSVGAEFKVMQELMRHSTLRTTMDVYTQAVAPAKHAAQAAVLALFFPATRAEDDEAMIGTG